MVGRSGDAGGKRVPDIYISLSWMHDFVRLTNNTVTNFPENEEVTVSSVIVSLCWSNITYCRGSNIEATSLLTL